MPETTKIGVRPSSKEEYTTKDILAILDSYRREGKKSGKSRGLR